LAAHILTSREADELRRGYGEHYVCVNAASKNQIALVFSDVNLSASVRFYVRVDVFAGVRRFRAVWVNFYPKTGEETFSLLFFWFSLSLVRLFATTTTTQKPTEEEEKYKSEEEEEEEYLRVSRDV